MTRPWRRRIAVGLAVVLLAIVCGLIVAFKTDVLLADLDVQPLGTETDAQTFLAKVAAYHGDPPRWSQQPTLEIRTRGTVPSVAARLALGLKSSEVELTLRYVPGEHGRYTYALKDEGVVRRGEVDTSRDRDELGLLLDSVRHLFELPFVAASVPFRRGLPDGVDGQSRAFFTWGDTPAATSAHDQIVLWSKGGRLTRMDTTGRDIAPFILARVNLEDEVVLGEFRLPKRATVLSASSGALVHGWEILSIETVKEW